MLRNIFKISLIIGLLVGFQATNSGQLIDATKIFTPDRDEREEQLAGFKSEFEKLQDSTETESKAIQDNLEQINRQINTTKDQIAIAPVEEQEFLNKKVAILNEIYQTLFNIQFVHKEILSTLEQHIKLLEEYKKDPNYKGLILEPRSFYSYELVQNVIRKVFDQEEKIRTLNMQKKDTEIELENRKKKLEAVIRDYQEKKKAQQEFASKQEEECRQTLDFKQRGELLDLQEKLAEYQRELANLRVQATTRKIALITTNIFTENEKFGVLKNNLARAKSGLRISEAEIKEAKEQLEKEKQKSLSVKDKQYDEIKGLTATREKLNKELEAISKRYEVANLDPEELATWSVETQDLESFTALCEIGYKKTQIQLLDRKIEYLRAQIQLEDVNFRRKEIKVMVLSTWFDFSQRKIKDGEEILQELKRFREIESEINRELNSFKDRQSAATHLLSIKNKELINLREFIAVIQKEKDAIFRRYPLRYNACVFRLAESEKIIGEQIDTNNRLLEVYSNAISSLNSIIKEINIIITELETKSIWQRSQYAVSWQGIRNIIPDLGYFLQDFREIAISYVLALTWGNMIPTITKLLHTPTRLLFWLLFLVFLFSFYYILKLRLPVARNYLLEKSFENRFSEISSKIIGCLAAFLDKHLIGVYSWFAIGLVFYLDLIPDLFPRIIYCLLSIPYLIYYARALVNFFIACNRNYKFPIFAELFEKRFSLVISIFFYMTIFVFFFREAFMLTTVHKSEFPNILLAAYSIILRALVIFSIGKEEILALITKRGPFWNWLARIIEDYYYLILVTIIFLMIMSDPYVGGYGNLVSYIIWGLIGSIILVRILYMIHTYVKKYSENIFFSTDEEVKRERFTYAKTWYGIFVIALFIIFVVLALAVGTKIWSIPITLEDLYKVLEFPLFSTGVDKEGKLVYFTPLSFLWVISFISAGFLLAVAFDRFVLKGIFDILPIDLGVQNTVMSITRYLIIFIAIYLGFQWAGLGNLLFAIGIAVVSISYILKEPVADFVSYFIILVQRPIQIGDYITISEGIQGVVRKITPRSIIIRRKDSYTIIVPNYTILTQVINNWSYARNFIAFEDIHLTISYKADPLKVKNIIQKVLDESTDVLKSPKPIIRLHEFGEYGLVFLVRGFLSNINILRRWDIASDIRFEILAKLREEKIKVAVPTRLILQEESLKQE
jgi:small-conductance mechanosensitive channel